MKKKNPVIEKARKEGYEAGVKVGFQLGEQNGIQKAIDFFTSKFEGLENVEGIGPKTFEKIVRQLGEEYFMKGEHRGNRTNEKS